MEINDPQMMFDEDITTKESLWVRRMMKLAKLVAENSPCVRRKVGCVITNKDHRIERFSAGQTVDGRSSSCGWYARIIPG